MCVGVGGSKEGGGGVGVVYSILTLGLSEKGGHYVAW